MSLRAHHPTLLIEELRTTSGYLGLDAKFADILISETQPMLAAIEKLVHDRFNIHHMAIQFECEGCDGPLSGHI